MKNKFFVFLVTIATLSCNQQGATSAATDTPAQTTAETAASASAQEALEITQLKL